MSRLERARNKQAFALLANHFEPQQNKFYCEPASATVVLNALRLGIERFPKPVDRRQFDPAATRYLPPGYDPVFAMLGQPGGGHISPLGAYDAVSDSFLVMDVNPNAGPWAWVPTDVLVAAMRTHDLREDRGYIVVHESNAAPGAR